MKYWFIIHSLKDYFAHSDFIGHKKGKSERIEKVNKGDKIVYYAKGDSVVVGTFEVVSNKKEWPDDSFWKGPHVVMKIKQRRLAKPPLFVRIHDLVENIRPPLSIFPKGKFKAIKFKDRTAVEITEKDFISIEKYIKSFKLPNNALFKGSPNDTNLGEPMDLEVMNYAPTSEQGVVALFSHFMTRIRSHHFVKIEFIRSGFPDACAIEKIGDNFSRKYIEFEFKASKFREHIKNKTHAQTRCDYVVCWENDFPSCPVEVIELKKEIASTKKLI